MMFERYSSLCLYFTVDRVIRQRVLLHGIPVPLYMYVLYLHKEAPLVKYGEFIPVSIQLN